MVTSKTLALGDILTVLPPDPDVAIAVGSCGNVGGLPEKGLSVGLSLSRTDQSSIIEFRRQPEAAFPASQLGLVEACELPTRLSSDIRKHHVFPVSSQQSRRHNRSDQGFWLTKRLKDKQLRAQEKQLYRAMNP